jgi:hypothetical protein
MMSTDLVQVQAAPLALEGAGFDFDSPLFDLRPGTLVINQPNTQDENAIKGNFRVTQTGDQFKTMTCVLIMTPEEARSYYIGEPGQMNRTAENLMCFSRDKGCHQKFGKQKPNQFHLSAKPHPDAKAPEALRCFGCPRSSWDAYRTYADQHPNQPVPKSLIPSCDPYFYAAFCDTEFQMPMEMYIRGDSIPPFELHCQNLYRAFKKTQAATKANPNIFDFQFTMETKLVEKGKNKYYVLHIPGDSIKLVSAEEKEKFGELYVQYAESRKKGPAPDPQGDADKAINAAVAGDAPAGIAGDDETVVF